MIAKINGDRSHRRHETGRLRTERKKELQQV